MKRLKYYACMGHDSVMALVVSNAVPTKETHGDKYRYCIGPLPRGEAEAILEFDPCNPLYFTADQVPPRLRKKYLRYARRHLT